MSLIYNPYPFTKESKQRAIKELTANTASDWDYYVLLVGAILLATGAVFLDSIPVLIASMIVAPLAYPILGLGLGITARSSRLIGRALGLLGTSCVIALGLAMLITLLFGNDRVHDTYVSFSGNRDVATAIAVVAGAIGAYGLVRAKVASAITGVAIAVSLMPPLVATGIGFVTGDRDMSIDAGTLFLLNIAGILIASVVVFSLLGLGKEYRLGIKAEPTSDR